MCTGHSFPLPLAPGQQATDNMYLIQHLVLSPDHTNQRRERSGAPSSNPWTGRKLITSHHSMNIIMVSFLYCAARARSYYEKQVWAVLFFKDWAIMVSCLVNFATSLILKLAPRFAFNDIIILLFDWSFLILRNGPRIWTWCTRPFPSLVAGDETIQHHLPFM